MEEGVRLYLSQKAGLKPQEHRSSVTEPQHTCSTLEVERRFNCSVNIIGIFSKQIWSYMLVYTSLIRKVPGSNLGPQTDYPDWGFRGSPSRQISG
jgi:hypothetical protein